jgi:hypothetical protein
MKRATCVAKNAAAARGLQLARGLGGRFTRSLGISSLASPAVAAAVTALLVIPHQAAASAPGRAGIEVGPGPVLSVLQAASRRLELRIVPNRANVWNTLKLTITKRGVLLRRAHVTVSMRMRGMQMGTQTFRLNESRSGAYSYVGSALVMPGLWDIELAIGPSGGRPFNVIVRDRVEA